MQGSKKYLYTLLSIICGLFIGLALTYLFTVKPEPVRGYRNAYLFREEVLQKLPIGSDINLAARKLRQSGFRCIVVVNDKYQPNITFSQAERLARKTNSYPSLEALKKGSGTIYSQWYVKIQFRDEKIYSVAANYNRDLNLKF